MQVGNQTLELDYYGNNHLPGNIFIYAPKQRVLMLVDIVFPGWIPFAYLAIAKDTAGFIQAHDIALNNYDFDNSCWTPHKAGNQSGRGGAERICHRFGKASCRRESECYL